MLKYFLLFLSIFVVNQSIIAQYSPGVGSSATTAIHADSAVFVSWATGCNLQLGYMSVADTSLGLAIFGTANSALGKADNDVVSLGDGGYAVLTFDNPIFNGPGFDFAVFENSFDGHFLELAFVEVSSDGVNFARFPAHSLTQTDVQIQAFDTINPRKINNLAGKYQGGYGTPFDLEELMMLSSVNVNQITHIRIVDVVGSVDSAYATTDTAGNFINDPFPTAFPSSGFDLDAIGIIHQIVSIDDFKVPSYSVFPNPAADILQLKSRDCLRIVRFEIVDLQGKICLSGEVNNSDISIDVEMLSDGLYFINCLFENGLSKAEKLMISR